MPIVTQSNVDVRWMRWTISILAAAGVIGMFPFHAAARWVWLIGSNGFALLLCVYFGWILFRRMQCSLLEMWIMFAVLGALEGLLISAPGLLIPGSPLWALIPLTAAWILCGTVKAMAQSKLFGMQGIHIKIALMLANWLTLAAPAAVLVGLMLMFGRRISEMLVSVNLANWGVWFVAAGTLGILGWIVLEIAATRAARRATKTIRFSVKK